MTPGPFGSDPIAEWKTRWIWKGWSTWHRINCETGNPAIPKHHGWDYVLYPKKIVGNGDVIEKVSLEDPPENHSNNPIPRDQISKSRVQTVLYQAILNGRKQTYWVEERVEMIHPKSIKKPYGKWKASTPSLNTNDLPGSYCCRSVKQAKRFTKQNVAASVCVRESACMLPIKHSILMQPDYNSRKVVTHHCNKCNIGTVCVNDITAQATLLANTRPVDIVTPTIGGRPLF